MVSHVVGIIGENTYVSLLWVVNGLVVILRGLVRATSERILNPLLVALPVLVEVPNGPLTLLALARLFNRVFEVFVGTHLYHEVVCSFGHCYYPFYATQSGLRSQNLPHPHFRPCYSHEVGLPHFLIFCQEAGLRLGCSLEEYAMVECSSVLRMQRIGLLLTNIFGNPQGEQVARADIRIRIRGRIVGVHVSEPVIRTVIRVAANIRTSLRNR